MSVAFTTPAWADESSIGLHYGSTGANVTVLQQDLQDLGYFPGNEGITQYFGPVTSRAVISYKKDHRLGSTDTVTQQVFSEIKVEAKKIAQPATSIGEKIANRALMYLGDPYVWGGTSPAGFDCSGFTQYVFAQFGITLPRTAADQANLGTPVAKNNLQAGDLVFFDTMGGISHVGIYLGNGEFVSAASVDVEKDSINDPYYWSAHYVTARRIR